MAVVIVFLTLTPPLSCPRYCRFANSFDVVLPILCAFDFDPAFAIVATTVQTLALGLVFIMVLALAIAVLLPLSLPLPILLSLVLLLLLFLLSPSPLLLPFRLLTLLLLLSSLEQLNKTQKKLINIVVKAQVLTLLEKD